MRIAIPITLALFTGANLFGDTILNLDNVLGNASFEQGNQAGGCPIGWTCGGSPAPGFTSFLFTAAQYTPGLDGLQNLPPGLGNGLVPGGTHAASSPVPASGTGTLSQTGFVGTYRAGITYIVELWIGTPLTLPSDNVTPVGQVSSIKFDFLGNSSLALLTLNAVVPTVGQWTPEQFSFAPTGLQIGQTVGLEIEVAGQVTGGVSIANFDVTPLVVTVVPEPATIGPASLALLGLGFAGRKFKRASRFLNPIAGRSAAVLADRLRFS